MHYITKHHTEQEWESHTCEISRIRFFIIRNAISIHNSLKNSWELSSAETRRHSKFLINRSISQSNLNRPIQISLKLPHKLFEIRLSILRHPKQISSCQLTKMSHIHDSICDLFPRNKLLKHSDTVVLTHNPLIQEIIVNFLLLSHVVFKRGFV